MDRQEIREIYRNKLQEADWMKEEHENNERLIEEIMEQTGECRCAWETVRDSLYGLSLNAEEQGFTAGFSYAVKLLFMQDGSF